MVFLHRAETIRCALDVLAICAVIPEVQLKLCETVKLPDDVLSPAIRSVQAETTTNLLLEMTDVFL